MIIRLILLIIALQTSSSVVVSQAITECERRLPNSYTKPQKQQLCRHDDSLGPAICASLAKQILHVKFEVILELCQDATSSAPVQCMSSLDNKASNQYGISICKHAISKLPGECFMDISSFPGTSSNKVKPEQTISFCTDLVDRAPLLCIHAVRNSSLLPIHQALDYCREAIGEVQESSSDLNSMVASCIYKMKPHLNPSFGLSGHSTEWCILYVWLWSNNVDDSAALIDDSVALVDDSASLVDDSVALIDDSAMIQLHSLISFIYQSNNDLSL